MLYGEKSREQLNDHAEKLFKEIVKRKDRRQLYDNVNKRFGMPIFDIEEMITFKRDIKEFTTFEVFCVMYFLDRDSLKKYFTKDEIAYLSKEKIIEEKISFPITFGNMVQIADDQWIGKITVQELMKLKKARLINYEEGEQRAFQRMKSGDIEIYKPFVSKRNVKEIKEAMESGAYIPDPITLNMPDGSNFSFENNTVTVYSLPKGMFNLDDGYHRYIAMSQIYDFDSSFDYPMELRLVNFSNAKANSFIFQQDQKTPMKKIVSDSYNVNAIPNKVVQRLNQDPMCNIQGMIGRNDAKINDAVLGKIISYFFVDKKIKKEDEMSQVIQIKNKLVADFNALTEQDERFLGKYDDVLLLVTMFVFTSDTEPSNYARVINQIYGKLSDDDKAMMKISTVGTVRKKSINVLEKLLREVRV